jgi:hypothetical protein
MSRLVEGVMIVYVDVDCEFLYFFFGFWVFASSRFGKSDFYFLSPWRGVC